jgi:hypothetical protein
MAKREVEYDTQGLKASIKHCYKNIATYELAIEDQKRQIEDYEKMIEVLETKKKLSEGIVLDANAVD